MCFRTCILSTLSLATHLLYTLGIVILPFARASTTRRCRHKKQYYRQAYYFVFLYHRATRKPARANPHTLGSAPSACLLACSLYINRLFVSFNYVCITICVCICIFSTLSLLQASTFFVFYVLLLLLFTYMFITICILYVYFVHYKNHYCRQASSSPSYSSSYHLCMYVSPVAFAYVYLVHYHYYRQACSSSYVLVTVSILHVSIYHHLHMYMYI